MVAAGREERNACRHDAAVIRDWTAMRVSGTALIARHRVEFQLVVLFLRSSVITLFQYLTDCM